MEKLEKLTKMTFSDYYNELSDEEKKDIRNSFLEKTGLSYPTFFSKLSRGNFSNLEREYLENRCDQKFNWQ